MESISQKTKHEHIPVFLSSDDRYAPFVATTIISIMSNTKSFVDFYILDGGISEINSEKIRSIKQQFLNFSIEFIKIDTKKEFKNFPVRLHFSIDMYTRYLIPQLKPELNKVIYSDVDVIFNGDIAELYEEDLNNFAIGAVPYTFGYLNPEKYEILSYHKRLNLSNKHKYFESGLLLLDCLKWRDLDITFVLLKKVRKIKPEVILTPDQDMLNMIFENNYRQLDNKYIVVPHRIQLMMINAETRPSIEDPFIYHFAGTDKPWNNPNMAFAEYFWGYAKESSFYDELLLNLAKNTQNKSLQTKRSSIILDSIRLAIFSPKEFVKKCILKVKMKLYLARNFCFSIYRGLPQPIKKIYRYIKFNIIKYEK